MSKYLKFQRLIAKAGLTIRERHVHYIMPIAFDPRALQISVALVGKAAPR